MATLTEKNNPIIWWKLESVQGDIKKATALYQKFGEQKNCDAITHFLLQFEALHALLLAYNRANFKNQADLYLCVCGLLEKEFDDAKRKELLATVNSIGINTLNEAFNILNQDCEDPLKETTHLFSFIKKHRLSLPETCSDNEILKNLSYYLNVTLINLNRIRNLKLKVDSEKLLAEKGRATKVVMPVVEKIFDLVLEGQKDEAVR